MKFFRQNMGLLVLLVAFLTALASSLLLLRTQIGRCNEIRNQREEKRAERDRLVTGKPFPSQENIKTMRQAVGQEKKFLAEALAPLRKVTLVYEPIEGWQFTKELIAARNSMEEHLRRSLVKIPELFQFGFERYEKTPPKKEHTPLLRKQLRIIEEMVKLCAESHYEIKGIRRAEFEDLEPSKPPPGLPPLISTSGKLEIMDFPAYLYVTMPFELRVTCDTEALRRFLNALETSDLIFVPRAIIVTNEKKDPLVAPKTAGGGEKAKSGTPATGPVIVVKPSAPPAPGRGAKSAAPQDSGWGKEEDVQYVIGTERLEVVLLIDWLEFRPPQVGKGKKSATTSRSSRGEGPR